MANTVAVTVRRATEGDAHDLFRIYSGRKAALGTFQIIYPSLEFWRAKVAEASPGVYMLVAEVEGIAVGLAGLHTFPNQPRRRHVAELGMGVHDDYAGQGIGSKLMEALVELADNWLAIVRIELQVFADNHAAIALYRKFDFEQEGYHRAFAFREGVYIDAISMARVRPAPGFAPRVAE